MTQMQVRELKTQYDQMKAILATELVWGRIGPKPPLIKAVVEKIQQVGSLEKAYSAQNQQLKAMIVQANQGKQQ